MAAAAATRFIVLWCRCMAVVRTPTVLPHPRRVGNASAMDSTMRGGAGASISVVPTACRTIAAPLEASTDVHSLAAGEIARTAAAIFHAADAGSVAGTARASVRGDRGRGRDRARHTTEPAAKRLCQWLVLPA